MKKALSYILGVSILGILMFPVFHGILFSAPHAQMHHEMHESKLDCLAHCISSIDYDQKSDTTSSLLETIFIVAAAYVVIATIIPASTRNIALRSIDPPPPGNSYISLFGIIRNIA